MKSNVNLKLKSTTSDDFCLSVSILNYYFKTIDSFRLSTRRTVFFQGRGFSGIWQPKGRKKNAFGGRQRSLPSSLLFPSLPPSFYEMEKGERKSRVGDLRQKKVRLLCRGKVILHNGRAEIDDKKWAPN